MNDYDERFEAVREQWLRGYFNWTEEKDITEAERHTARDGFDAGANYVTKQFKKSRANLKLALLFIIVVGSALGVAFVKSPENAVFALLIGFFGMDLVRELRS